MNNKLCPPNSTLPKSNEDSPIMPRKSDITSETKSDCNENGENVINEIKDKEENTAKNGHKKPGYWTVDRAIEEARKYKTKNDFRWGSKGAYNVLRREDLVDYVFGTKKKKSANYWTAEKAIKEARKYKYKADFKRAERGAYNKLFNENLLNEAFKDYLPKKPKSKLTKAVCREEAKKYSSRVKFARNSALAYCMACKKGWLNEVCVHMVSKIHHYTFKECKEIASKFEFLKDFREAEPCCHHKVYKKGWAKKVCGHMLPIGHKYKRLIYVFEFEDNTAYIGLTYNSQGRHGDHLANTRGDSAVGNYIKVSGLAPVYKELTTYIDAQEAQKEEDKFIKRYKSDGWNVLNKMKGGGLGGGIVKWDRDAVIAEAKKYTDIKGFRLNSKGAYQVLRKNPDWRNEAYSHMENLPKYPAKWFYDKDRCRTTASEYNTIRDFRKGCFQAFYAIKKFHWEKELCPHLKFKNI